MIITIKLNSDGVEYQLSLNREELVAIEYGLQCLAQSGWNNHHQDKAVELKEQLHRIILKVKEK